ncbi:MAG: ATP-binding cassette domain-containing protein [Planctomycetes bacterium]|nr:ATP-binding cassette domain-containing protein [Planctomycetota bacterium]
MSAPLLEVDGLRKWFPIQRGWFGGTRGAVRAVDGVSFRVGAGETVACVGESGSGKSTLGRALLRLVEPDAGTIRVHGPQSGQVRDVLAQDGAELRKLRRELQIVFQDPYASLNPRMRVVDLVGEGLVIHGLARGGELRDLVLRELERVGLDATALDRYPHAFSGGQRQRISIARALALSPRFLVLDEAVSALDVSVQAQILNLLADLRADLGLAYFFITHDLGIVRHFAQRVLVLYLGRIVEEASAGELFAAPKHPYTKALLSAVPIQRPGETRARIVLEGEPPSPAHPPSGCSFHTRCPVAVARCVTEEPQLRDTNSGGRVACHLAE